ncbi:MAG: anti-sigma factor [Humibacillus sp.]
MSHPREEELVDLALGLDATDGSVAAHAARCARCSGAVAELRHAAALVSALPPNAGWQAPNDAVWSRITDELDADAPDEAPSAPIVERVAPTAASEPVVLTTWRTAPSDVDVATRHTPVADVDVPTRPTLRSDGRGAISGRRAAGWGALLAAAGVAVGLLAGRALWQPADAPAPRDVAQVALSTLDTKQAEGRATVVRSSSGLDLTVATTQPLDQKDGYLEVWLLNSDGKRMVSVGVLAPGEASFPISQRLIDEGYVIVDISREPFDDKPAHSGNSLLRGKLPA